MIARRSWEKCTERAIAFSERRSSIEMIDEKPFSVA
jgi:hypothetical protein